LRTRALSFFSFLALNTNTHTRRHTHTLSLCLCLSLSHIHAHQMDALAALSPTHTHPLSFSLPLSLKHTHTHTHTQNRWMYWLHCQRPIRRPKEELHTGFASGCQQGKRCNRGKSCGARKKVCKACARPRAPAEDAIELATYTATHTHPQVWGQ